jgi:hypothetical protein
MKKGTLIELEGADGTGKTSLAEAIARRAPDPWYMHATYNDKIAGDMFGYFSNLYARALLGVRQGRTVIMDRGWISEELYAQAYRGGTRWPMIGRFMDRLFNKMGGIRIHCLHDGTVDRHQKKFNNLKKTRHELYGDISPVARLFNDVFRGRNTDKYDRGYAGQIMNHHGYILRPKNYYYSIEAYGHNIDLFYEIIIKPCIEKEAISFIMSDNCLGDFERSKVLMVGDEVCRSHKDGPRWPFHRYYNSGLFLTERLHRLQVDEGHIYWVNINEKDSIDIVSGWLRRHPGRTVICLGENAARTFRRFFPNKSFEKIMHPQAAARFPFNRRKFQASLRWAMADLTL